MTATAAAATAMVTKTSMEVRAWEKINPQGDAYSPRTGHTVTSNSTSRERQANALLAHRSHVASLGS